MDTSTPPPGLPSSAEPRKRNKRLTKRHGPDHAIFEEVNVLVTGFEPLGGLEENAAWLIAKSLPPFLDTSAAHPSRIRITVHPDPIPVTYDASAHFLSKIISPSVEQRYHVVLHLGVDPDIEGYSIENRARGSGYLQKDNNGKLPDHLVEPDYWDEFLPILATTASMEDILARWQSDFPDDHLCISDDAGHSASEYLFYSSMAFMKAAGNPTRDWEERTTVAFMRLPPAVDEESIAKGRRVAESLLYSFIDSRRQRDGDFDGDETQVVLTS